MSINVTKLLQNHNAANTGPIAKEYLLNEAVLNYKDGNIRNSLFYQVCALYQGVQDLYYSLNPNPDAVSEDVAATSNFLVDLKHTNGRRHFHPEDGEFISCIYEYLAGKMSAAAIETTPKFHSSNFLCNISDPTEGIAKIMNVCQQLPKEWTVLQLCKGPRRETTWQNYEQIRQSHAPIYLSILKHVFSNKYPEPICMRFTKTSIEAELYLNFAHIGTDLKKCICVDPSKFVSVEEKKAYWAALSDVDKKIEAMIAALKEFFFPWSFLFTGIPFSPLHGLQAHKALENIQTTVDKFCDKYNWSPKNRTLLCLAMLHAPNLTRFEMLAICNELTRDPNQQKKANELLEESVIYNFHNFNDTPKNNMPKYFPCILILDAQLDHFFWEEINVEQDFYRFSSFQCLWRLYQFHRQRFQNGYLMTEVSKGGCIINPDNNLKNMEKRMRAFFEYWTPSWNIKCGEQPTRESLFDDMFKRDCYVYCGHGSGLQYFKGRDIGKQKCNAVSFLFGCDSLRSFSNGLYSELIGTHLYYHAAFCPTLVGTILPALDCFIDNLAAWILSQWVMPSKNKITNWPDIVHQTWIKKGIIEAKTSVKSTSQYEAPSPNQSGCLGYIVANIHHRKVDAKFFNTCIYVCRGLPVWNKKVQAFPF